MDKITAKRRSENMSAIKGSSTKPELFVRQYLTKNGVRYRCNVRDLPGRPDIAIKKYKLALNVHGCFWHGHQDCRNFRLPRTNVEFWREKLSRNRERDAKNRDCLIEAGFRYHEIWQCEIERGDFRKLDLFIDEYWSSRGIG